MKTSTILVVGGVLAAGLYLYARSSRAPDRTAGADGATVPAAPAATGFAGTVQGVLTGVGDFLERIGAARPLAQSAKGAKSAPPPTFLTTTVAAPPPEALAVVGRSRVFAASHPDTVWS